MRKLLLILIVAACAAPAAHAQDQWSFKELLAPDANTFSGHGIAVDPDGKIWFQSYYALDSVLVNDIDGEYHSTRVVQVFNPDGSEASISPIKFYSEGGAVVDTLGGETVRDSNGDLVWSANSGRGLRADENGNIIVTAWAYNYKFDYQTGEGLGYTKVGDVFCAGVAPGVASLTGHVFIASVCPGSPIMELDQNLDFVANAVDASIGYSRSFEVSADGNKIYWAGYSNHDIVLYERAGEFSAFDSMGVVIPGMDSESFGWQPTTGWLWVSAGCLPDTGLCTPNSDPDVTTSWEPMTHYAFDPAELAVDVMPTPKAFLTWEPTGACADALTDANCGRPRGIAFSPDGTLAYTTNFGAASPSVQVFSAVPVAIEKLDDTVPDKFILMQAYPNPFNPSTTINFMLHEAGHARLAVYDVTGREIQVLADQTMAPGTYQYRFDATGLSSGVYLYRLDFNGQVATGRMTLVK